MNIGDIPSACPVASAAPTRISLIHAAPSEAARRVPPARLTLHATPCSASSAFAPGEDLRVGPEHEDQVEPVGRQEHERDAGVQRLRVPRSFGAEKSMKRAGHDHADGRQQHHGRVGARRRRIVFLRAVTQAPEEKGEPEGEQQVGEQGADERRAHHLEQPRAERHHRDDQLRQVAARRVEQPTERGRRCARRDARCCAR